MKHYIYKITNNDPTDSRKYYIGVKSSPNPETDNYWGSSDSLKEAIGELGLNAFTKEILSVWDTREQANAEEIRIHWEINVATDEKYYNKANATSSGFCTHGQTTVLDTRDGKTKNVTINEYSSNPNLIHNRNEQIPVLDLRDKTMKSVTRENFEKFDYFVHSTKGQATVLDTRDGKTKNIPCDEFQKYDYYISCTVGQVTVKDTRDGKTKNVSKEEFKKNRDFYQTNAQGKVVVINKKDKSKYLMTKEELVNNKDYELFSTKGLMPVIDKRTNEKLMVSIDEYKMFDYYVSRKSKKMKICDKNHNIIYRIWGDLDKVCEDNNLPRKLFWESFKNNGIGISYPSTKGGKTRFINKNYKQFLGWYMTLEN